MFGVFVCHWAFFIPLWSICSLLILVVSVPKANFHTQSVIGSLKLLVILSGVTGHPGMCPIVTSIAAKIFQRVGAPWDVWLTVEREREMMRRRAESRQARDGLHSTAPQQGSGLPWKAENGWFVKASVRGLGCRFTYRGAAGGFYVNGSTKPNNFLCSAKEGDLDFYAYREQTAVTCLKEVIWLLTKRWIG